MCQVTIGQDRWNTGSKEERETIKKGPRVEPQVLYNKTFFNNCNNITTVCLEKKNTKKRPWLGPTLKKERRGSELETGWPLNKIFDRNPRALCYQIYTFNSQITVKNSFVKNSLQKNCL